MNCQECHQNPATLHFTKIINGKKTEMHLCERCAQEKGEFFSGTNGFSMNSLLSGLLNFDQSLGETTKEKYETNGNLECDICGLTYNQFSKRGRFGCTNCYKTFQIKLEPVLKRVHSGNTTHGGKVPKRIGGDIHIRKEIKFLKQQIQECIIKEEFESAAQYRDQIKELEQKLKRDGEEGA